MTSKIKPCSHIPQQKGMTKCWMKSHFQISGLYYKSFTIVTSDCNDWASSIKLNYDCKALASVINYNSKCDPQFGASM